MEITTEDKWGRAIRIALDDEGEDVVAFHEENEIGRFDFYELEPSCFKLRYLKIEKRYQRAGIGMAMMRYAVARHGKNFVRPPFDAEGGRERSSEEYYTHQGRALILKCLRLGIVAPLDGEDIPEEKEGLLAAFFDLDP